MSHLLPLIQKSTTFSKQKQILSHLITSNLLQTHPHLRSKLLDLAATSTSTPPSFPVQIFSSTHHPVTNDFNAILRGISVSPYPSRAFSFYSRMHSFSSFPSPSRPDALSLSFTLKSCASVSALSPSVQLHSHVLLYGVFSDVILATTLVDAYAKSGSLDDAEKVFEEMPFRDIATWNSLIINFANGNRPHDALSMFNLLKDETSINSITIVGALSASAQLGSSIKGEQVLNYAKKHGLHMDIRVCNAVVDMYSKCGLVTKAEEVFRKISNKTLVSWNAILNGYAMHGHGARALELYYEMVTEGKVEPDKVTYLAVLCGCNHAGLVEEGMGVFRSMKVDPTIKHYGAVVDLLGRAGKLKEAYDVVMSIPCNVGPDVVLWQTLLGACKTYGDVELAEEVSVKLRELGSNGCGDYVLLSNVYAAKERWEEVGKVRGEMVKNDVRKVPGFSYLEIDGVVHRFLNGDREHERWKEIYEQVEEIGVRIKKFGYIEDVSCVLHDVEEEDKENALCHHSEKLAIAYGLISTEEGRRYM